MKTLLDIYDLLKESNMISTSFRIVLAALIGGFIGINRGRNGNPTGT